MKRPLTLISLSFLLIGAGCSISFSSSRVKNGGVFVSTTFGEEWEQKVFVSQEKKHTITISNADITSIVVSPLNADEVTVTTLESGVYRSLNNGDQWTKLPLNDGHYPTFVYDPGNASVQYTAHGPTILKTSDNGATWESVYTESLGQAITALAVDRYDTSRLYAGTGSGIILKSVNFGIDWSVIFNAENHVRSIVIRSDNTRTLYLLTSANGIFRSTNAGDDWTNLRPKFSAFPGSNQSSQLLISPHTNSTLYLASKYGLLKSINSGDTWEIIPTLIQPNTLQVWTVGLDSENPNILYYTVNNLLHKSEDGGRTWKTIEKVPTNRLIARLTPHPQRPGVLYLGTFLVK